MGISLKGQDPDDLVRMCAPWLGGTAWGDEARHRPPPGADVGNGT